jgi:hypothetical protein
VNKDAPRDVALKKMLYDLQKKTIAFHFCFYDARQAGIVVKKAMATLHSSNTLSNNDRWKATSPADWVI